MKYSLNKYIFSDYYFIMINLSTYSIVITALIYKFTWNPKYLYNYFSLNNWNFYYPLLFRLSEITWAILLITSNTFSQRILWCKWKKIQRLSYIYFLSWWIIIAQYSPYKSYPIISIIIILWLISFIRNKKQLK